MRHIMTKLIYNEKYHDNCHDYLKEFYLQRYLVKKYLTLFREIRNTVPLLQICERSNDDIYKETIVCDQHAVVFTHHQDKYPVLATYALNACVSLIMYDKDTHVACLSHMDGLPGYSRLSAKEDGMNINFSPVEFNIDIILSKMANLMPPQKEQFEFDCYLVGGIFDLSEVMVNDVIEYLGQLSLAKPNFKFILRGRNLLGPENQARNICFDTRTGKITYFDFIDNALTFREERINGLPPNIIKAPRKNEALLDITYIPKNRVV